METTTSLCAFGERLLKRRSQLPPSQFATQRNLVAMLAVVFCLVTLTSCETLSPEDLARRDAMNAAIRTETPGNYFLGRRMFKINYKVWGWVRQPQQPWKDAKLVMFNEQKMLTPDRKQGKLGGDNGYEYRLQGYFSGDEVYEPASNIVFPEFVLTDYEVRSKNPPNIYLRAIQNSPKSNIFTPPL